MFIDNDQFLKNMDVERVAVPKNVDLSDRKSFNTMKIATELHNLNQMSQNSETNLAYLRDNLRRFQVDLISQPFKVSASLTGDYNTTQGENFFTIIEGRKNLNMECYAIAFDPCILLDNNQITATKLLLFSLF